MKELLSAAAIALTFALFVPYIRDIHRGRLRPHVFSWVIWALGTVVVFFAQLADGAGVGAWAIGVSGCITAYIAALAWAKRADTAITPTDWAFFLAAASAMPLWFVTRDPLAAVVVLTAVDTVGFGPTVRRAYHRPREESAAFFALGALRNALVIAALERYTPATVLFPAVVGAACLALAAMLVLRRRRVGPRL